MAVMEKELAPVMNDNQYIRHFLNVATPKQMYQFVATLESEINDGFMAKMKTLAFMKFERELEINHHYFNTNNAKRFPTQLYFEPNNGGQPVLFISVKDSRDEDGMRARLFDAHRDQLLELWEKRGAQQ